MLGFVEMALTGTSCQSFSELSAPSNMYCLLPHAIKLLVIPEDLVRTVPRFLDSCHGVDAGASG